MFSYALGLKGKQSRLSACPYEENSAKYIVVLAKSE